MTELHEEIEIGVSADRAWRLLSDFGSAHRYVPDLASSRMEGPIRVCVTRGGHEIREQITEVSAETRSFRYRHVELPMPAELSHGRFSVRAAGTRCVVGVDAVLVAASPEMQAALGGVMRDGLTATLENLRRLLEEEAAASPGS